jgi:hypothetical protein
MRFVQIKSQEQLDIQAMYRVRDRLVQRRTGLINEIRGFLLDRGLTFTARPIELRRKLPSMIEDAEQNLSSRLRWLLDRLWREWKQMEIDIKSISERSSASATRMHIASVSARLRREGDERTVQRCVGKPAVENASFVTERFIRTDARGSSSSVRRAILH